MLPFGMFDLLMFWRGYVQHAVIVLLFLYAWVRGGPPERCAGAILLGMVLLDYVHLFIFSEGGTYQMVDLGHAAIDVLALIAFGLLALRANRIYPLCMLGAQLISTLMHVNREILPDMHDMAYLLLMRAPSYLLIFALFGGLLAHRRRTKIYGNYRSWRHS